MDKKQIEEYLAKYNIANKEQLSLHIEQLRRNTSPNVRLINELEWIREDGYFGEEKPYFTTTVTPVSQFFSAEKERVKNIFATNVQEALQRAEEHQAQFGRKESYEAERYSSTVANQICQEKVKTVLDDITKDDTIFNSNRTERDTMEFLKEPYKETEGKLYYELSWEFIEAMAQRMQYHKNGKYELYNWKKNPMTPKGIDDMKQAINRHHIEVMKGNHNDGEEILGHIVSYATNSMILWEQLKLNKS